MGPPIQLFLTTIASQPALRQRQEYLLRTLQVKKISFRPYDLASDETAKSLWKRKVPADKQQLPGILVGDSFPGTFSEFEEAVEYGELDRFLRLSEPYTEPGDDEDSILRPAPLPEKPIGVPGVATPLQMTPKHLQQSVSAPTSTQKTGKKPEKEDREGEFDVSTELSGYGLQGVKVTEAELADLVRQLGLKEEEAGDLVKGLSESVVAPRETEKKERKHEDTALEEPENKEPSKVAAEVTEAKLNLEQK